jgi:membrane-associated protein
MPHESLEQLIQIVGYPGVFGAIFAESGIPFGFFLPGASLLFTAGLLASQGFFNPWILIPGVTIAAIAGDAVGFWFGRKVGYKLFLRPDSRFFKHEHLQKAQVFFERYGARTILFARFIPVVRTFAPIVAGIANMSVRTFAIYNVLGGLIWATGITSLAYFLGKQIPQVADYLTYIIVGIIVVSSIPLFIEAWRAHKESGDKQ